MNKFVFETLFPAFAVLVLIGIAFGAMWFAGAITASPGYYSSGGDRLCTGLYALAGVCALAVLALKMSK